MITFIGRFVYVFIERHNFETDFNCFLFICFKDRVFILFEFIIKVAFDYNILY